MSGDNENLRGALKALAGETSRAHASPRVHDALRVELRARARRRHIAVWWPAAAAAALIIGLWLGLPRKSAVPRFPHVAVAEPAPAPPPATAPVGTDRELSQPEPLPTVTRAVAPVRTRNAAVAPQPPASAAAQPLTPWYFYTGLPVSTRGQVVRILVSNQTAAQFGVVTTADAVPAQVFIGDDGITRAIRFVQ